MASGYGPYSEFKGHDTVGGIQTSGPVKIDLVLAGSRLMVGALHPETHILQGQYNIPAGVFSHINGAQIKITGLLRGAVGRPSLLVGLKQEKLASGTGVKLISQLSGPADTAFQNAAGTALVRCSVRLVHIADHPGHLPLLGPPGQDHKTVQVRMQIHICPVLRPEPFQGRSIKHALIIQGLFQLAGGNRDIPHGTEHIRKLKADKLHIFLLRHREDLFPGVISHMLLPPCQIIQSGDFFVNRPLSPMVSCFRGSLPFGAPPALTFSPGPV